ncbi:hypothetical protein HK103_001066 [Boothiomyces macroporosus]|uniref:Uncharacterized protein n=1 Tax=Boothiomyces macroporosus TaxID=261099 RepID=A0AAD5UF28_9FUNG|nr:hypothetical protein HK103_001066 [Boothiomyces macroporosus]
MESPKAEQHIQTKLEDILNKVQAEDVNLTQLWNDLMSLVKELFSLRSSTEIEHQVSQGHHISTKSDKLIDDILPLFFKLWSKQDLMSPNTFTGYLALTKIHHKLDDLKISGLFNSQTLTKLSNEINMQKKHIPLLKCADGECYKQGLSMLSLKEQHCETVLKELQTELSSISDALIPIHSRLIEIKLELNQLIARKNPHAFSLVEVQILQDEVREIDSVRIDGKFMTKDGKVVPGQASHELLASRDPVVGDNPLRHVYEELIKIKGKLEHFTMTLKGDDLIPYQVKLGQIDNMRVDGKFMVGDTVPPGQACYRFIYKLQSACEPVDESLMYIFNQLVTLQKCLLQLKRWNVNLTYDELIPYQVKIQAINGLQVDGKFHDDEGNIPEGQAILFEMLDNCHELIRELQMKCKE